MHEIEMEEGIYCACKSCPKVFKNVLVTVNRDLDHRCAQGGIGGVHPLVLTFTISIIILFVNHHMAQWI